MMEVQNQTVQFRDLRKYISEDTTFKNCTINYKDRDGLSFSKMNFAERTNTLRCKAEWIFDSCVFESTPRALFFVDLSEQKSPTYKNCTFECVAFANSVNRVSHSKFFAVPNTVKFLDFSQLTYNNASGVVDFSMNVSKFKNTPQNISSELWIHSEKEAKTIMNVLSLLGSSKIPCVVNFEVESMDTSKFPLQKIFNKTSAGRGSNLRAYTENFIVDNDIDMFSEVQTNALVFRDDFSLSYDMNISAREIRVENSSNVSISIKFRNNFKNVRWDIEEGSSVTFGDQLITSSGNSNELLKDKKLTQGSYSQKLGRSSIDLKYSWNLFKDEDKKDWDTIVHSMSKNDVSGDEIAENMFDAVYDEFFIDSYNDALEAFERNPSKGEPSVLDFWERAKKQANQKAMNVLREYAGIVSFKEFISK